MNNLERDLKWSRIFLGFLSFLLILQSGLFLYMVTVESDDFKSYDQSYDTEFIYLNLTEEEIEIVEGIMSQVNPIFMYQQQKIIFTNETPSVCEDKCGGANVGRGREIYIMYHSDPYSLRKTIGHELMHTYMIGSKGSDWEHPFHQIVFELARQEVVFG